MSLCSINTGISRPPNADTPPFLVLPSVFIKLISHDFPPQKPARVPHLYELNTDSSMGYLRSLVAAHGTEPLIHGDLLQDPQRMPEMTVPNPIDTRIFPIHKYYKV